MDALPRHTRNYRPLLYVAASVAAVLLLAVIVRQVSAFGATFGHALAIAVAAVWILSLLLFALYSASPTARLIVVLAIASVVLMPIMPLYSHLGAALGLPFHLDPVSAWMYGTAYQRGKADATRDVAAGVLAVEVYGMGAGAGRGVELLSERFGIDTRVVAGCGVDLEILGHAAGYNKVSEAEIDRRFGSAAIQTARAEGARLDDEAYEEQKRADRRLAARVSSFSAQHHVVLTSLSVHPPEAVAEGHVSEQELLRVVHGIEEYVGSIIPADVAPFELSVYGHIAAGEAPTATTNGNGALPKAIYREIYERVQTLPDVRAARGTQGIGYRMEFGRRHRPADMPVASSH